ncbi:MAG: MORN repeat-containing protein [Spirochaetota bacterium]
MTRKKRETQVVSEDDDGTATLILKDGSKYVGELEDGVAHGHGKIVLTDGREISGTFEDGMPHGTEIELTFPDGRKYIGEYRHGNRQGYGTMYFPDGDVFEGNWKNDLPHGAGTITHTDGSVERGEWKKGKKVLPHPNESGFSPKSTLKLITVISILVVIGVLFVSLLVTAL